MKYPFATSLVVAALLGAVAAASEGPRRTLLDLPRSTDDRGFSLMLLSPTDLFLTGRHILRIEAIIPRGDAIEQVDFFLDGRLVATDREDPYETVADFGRDIRRRTIEIRATTREGRRARVSLVTRSGDVTEGAAVPVLSVPVVARHASGEFMDDLGVSDFVLLEDGAAREITYFAPGPFPASIALVLEAGADEAATLTAPLAGFLRGLPGHHATALVEGPFASAEAASGAFSFDPDPVIARLGVVAATGDRATRLEDRVRGAAAALGERRGLRVLLVVLAAGRGAANGGGFLEEPLVPALEAALETGAAVYAVVAGGDAGAMPAAEALHDAAGRSGGAFFTVPDMTGLETALGEAGADLRNRYVLGFVPAEEGRTGWRAIQVRLRAREAALRSPRSVFLQ